MSILSILSSKMIPAGQIAMVPVIVASSVLQPLCDGDNEEGMDHESWLDHKLKSIQQLDFHDFFGLSIFHRPSVCFMMNPFSVPFFLSLFTFFQNCFCKSNHAGPLTGRQAFATSSRSVRPLWTMTKATAEGHGISGPSF